MIYKAPRFAGLSNFRYINVLVTSILLTHTFFHQ
jgi:hypothetical protein